MIKRIIASTVGTVIGITTLNLVKAEMIRRENIRLADAIVKGTSDIIKALKTCSGCGRPLARMNESVTVGGKGHCVICGRSKDA